MSDVALRVCVTGSNGLIGSHVVRELLVQGFQVKATLRVVDDPSKNGHLRALAGAERLEFAKMDLEQPGDVDGLLDDCDALIHCATAVKFAAKDPQREIVDVAVHGTTRVMAAAARSERTKQVVHLSSIAAIVSYTKPQNTRFTSKDWCEDASLQTNPYALAKTLSERVAHESANPRAGATGYRLTCINPGYVLGPLLAKSHQHSSPGVVADILSRKFPACPPINFSVVDVRDVAEACVRVLTAELMGHRLCLVAGNVWWQEMARILAKEYPARGIRVGRLPVGLVYAAALFDKRVQFPMLKRILNRVTHLDGETAAATLGLSYRPLHTSIRDTAASMFQLELMR
ncbi:MAG: hypothetical protein RJA70_1787 [Pseudomonadota bacterium]|jgi:dihydroflavonol-4-reductase